MGRNNCREKERIKHEEETVATNQFVMNQLKTK